MSSPKKKIAVLVEDLYQVLEVWYPLLRLKEEGIDTCVVGSGSKDIYGSKEGYPVKIDASINDVRAEDFDAVIVPGGWAPDILRRFDKMVGFVKEMSQQGKVVAAICHGGWMLVSADIVRGHKATCFFAIKDDLKAAGADYVDEEVVVDGNIITARKPEDLPAFVKEIIRQVNA